MAGKEYGSLTKEPPLTTLDATIRAVTPGMSYASLLAHARAHTHRDAPGLVSKRFLLLSGGGTIIYDYFLSLATTHPLEGAFIRKIMYFLWAYRDERIRRFVCERIANDSGRWRVTQLLNKDNSDFFEQWFQPSTATKARSNFEYFLVETKLYDLKSRTVHLELDDGWLEHAAIAAAQHESDELLREELLANPIAFLEHHGWMGLLNTDRTNLPVLSPILSVDSLPLEDIAIRTEPMASQSGSDWQRRRLISSGRRSTTVEVDLVARERANSSHYMLEEIIADVAKALGFSPKRNQNIDMYFDTPNGPVLLEIKSCTDTNFHAQLRKGISQLFEYRFLYQNLLGSEAAMVLLMESAPPADKGWLVKYVQSLGITLAWKDPLARRILTTGSLPEVLSNLLTLKP